MTSSPRKPTLTSGTDNPASPEEIKQMSEGADEAQDANEAMREEELDEHEADLIPGLRQSDIQGSSD